MEENDTSLWGQHLETSYDFGSIEFVFLEFDFDDGLYFEA